MSVNFSPCVVIPCYNHGAMMAGVLSRLSPFALPCFIVDDGSDSATQRQLEALANGNQNVQLIHLPQNAGKGAAVVHGLTVAAQHGFTHAVQVDADGQHAIEDIPALLALAQQYPDDLISGAPIYDDSIPRSRLYGRWITHVWVWIETLSLQLKDSMCGFRVYPIAPTLRLANQVTLGKRMDFDTEVMVRLYWQGHNSHFVPTRVTYPEDGLSHFDAFKDNVRISCMHTRLFFGMLPRLPALLLRQRHTQHWAKQQEVSGLWGMRIMLKVWQYLGRNAFSVLLWPVVAVYWLLARRARAASQQWLNRVKTRLVEQNRPVPPRLNSYFHFLRFSQSMLDKIASWRGELQPGKQIQFAPGAQEHLDLTSPQGQLLLASHLGDVEVCRALAQLQGDKTINALVFHENAQRFKQIMEEMAPQAGLNLIPVNDIGPETAMLLKEKLDQGEWVAIVGDRLAVNPQRGDWRVTWSQFMGHPAPFPQGPFILASILRCPVFLLFALSQHGQLCIHCEPFANPLLLPRGNRQQALQQTIDRYAERLEHYALMSPLDWFNFFDFWRLPDADDKE